MVTISVYLASGKPVFSDLSILSQEYGRELRERAESKLGLQGSNTRCSLLLNGRMLTDSERLCDFDICDGGVITAVITQQDPEFQLPDTPDIENDEQVESMPVLFRLFLGLWLMGWLICEVFIASITEQMAFGSVVQGH
jgi:hypothetical protein